MAAPAMLRIDGESAFVFVLVQETYTVCALFPDHTCNQLQFVTQGWERFLKPPPLSKQVAQVF